jgi:hypothetical protein
MATKFSEDYDKMIAEMCDQEYGQVMEQAKPENLDPDKLLLHLLHCKIVSLEQVITCAYRKKEEVKDKEEEEAKDEEEEEFSDSQ